MSSAEFSLWIKLDQEEPWDEDFRHDLRAGIVAAAVANYAGKVLPEGVRATPSNFMPFLEKEDTQVIMNPDPVEFFGKFLNANSSNRRRDSVR